jgi:hypothetical protein
MTRTQTRRLVWNGVIYGMSFAVALFVAALLQPAHELPTPIATASIDQPIAETTPATSIAEINIP